MSKFKVGDRVMVIGTISGTVIDVKPSGVVVECDEPDKGVEICQYPNKMVLWPNESQVELIAPSRYELHITCNDGKTTNAVYKVNGKIEKRTEAKCSPSDVFDFAIGAQEAFDRAFPKAQPTQPIAPQEDKPRFSIGQRVIATDNTRHFIKQIATILDIDKSDPRTPFKVKFDERGLIMWCHSGDVEPCPEPEQLKEPIKLYCVKDYKALLSPMFTRGKIYETDENEQIKADSGLTTYRKWNSDKMKKEFPEMFASLIPLVKRPAKVGEWIYVSDAVCGYGQSYKTGDIFKVISRNAALDNDVKVDGMEKSYIDYAEYLVLDGYTPEPEKEPEPVYYSGKVVCVDHGGYPDLYTAGKIYTFTDGQMTNDDGCRPNSSYKCKSFEELEANFSAKFIPYLGE